MGIHHLAFVVRNMAETHRFYTEAMGFELVKVEVAPMPDGLARHVFYSTGDPDGQLIAFWDYSLKLGFDPDTLTTDIARGLGLPPLSNHLAFAADGPDDLRRRIERWNAYGLEVLEVDHGWCHSIYTEDPDRIAVEFSYTTQPFTDADRLEAARLMTDTAPEPSPQKSFFALHRPDGSVAKELPNWLRDPTTV